MSNTTANEAKTPNAAANFAEFARAGVENFVATQKALLDLASHQNAILMDAWKQRMNTATATQAASQSSTMADLAGQGVQGFIQAQKILLDLAAQQNALALAAMKDAMGPSVAPLADLMKQGSDTFLETQKRLLDLASQQSEMAMKAAREGVSSYASQPLAQLAELARKGVETFVETQKRLLDLASDQARASVSNITVNPGEQWTRSASAGMDQFVAAQKTLLDMASQQMAAQMNLAGQFLRGGLNMGMPQAPSPFNWADASRLGMEQYLNAQKTFLDLLFRPRS